MAKVAEASGRVPKVMDLGISGLGKVKICRLLVSKVTKKVNA
jgi:hypothetical protein